MYVYVIQHVQEFSYNSVQNLFVNHFVSKRNDTTVKKSLSKTRLWQS